MCVIDRICKKKVVTCERKSECLQIHLKVFELIKLLKSLLLFLMIGLFACARMDDKTAVTFIGDSLIARWDVENSFPICEISNIGLMGSGVEWIEQNRGLFSEVNVVALTGTNDLMELDKTNLESYTSRYVEAMIGLNAKRLILVSILPRNSESDAQNINQLISELNQMIAEKIKEEKAIAYCDVFPAFLKNGTLNMNLSYDGIHLNQYGYEILAKKIKSLL